MYILSSLKARHKTIFSLTTSGLAIILFSSSIQAQIVPDTTLGTENSLVTPNLNINGIPSERIDGGAIRGTNLFHSFQEFNINEGRGAYFTNAAGIENIISRVTGANPSNILGKLGVLGGNANLFLINPRGIVFGSNASLDVGGSFVATTASSINFADGTQFTAQPSQGEPLLTVSIPIGLEFRNNPGNILVQGNGRGTRLTNTLIDTNFGLRVPPRQVLALIGGNVTIDGGTVKSSGGRIEIGSVLSSGTVGINTHDPGDFSFDYTNISALGEIQLIRQAAVDASGFGAGDIQIRGGRLLLANGSQIESSTLTEESGGIVTVNVSDAVEITGTSASNRILPSGISAFVYRGATGSGANLNITARTLILKEAGTISTATLGFGTGGNLSIKADEIEVIGTLVDGRRGGGIATSVAPRATGKAGDLRIETRRLLIRNGGVVSTTSLGRGEPGDLFVRAAEFVELAGSANKETPSILSARAIGTADSGNITVETQELNILGKATVSVRNDGSGEAGTLTINANSISLDNQGGITASTAFGEGGNIFLQADNLQLRQGSTITATAGTGGGSGTGGNITINTDTLVALENSDITANAFTGRGGNIEINAQGVFRSLDSDISASSTLGINGIVEINTPDTDPSSTIVKPVEVSQTSEVASVCQGRSSGETSSFVITGTGGIPPSPDDVLYSTSGWYDTSVSSQVAESSREPEQSTATEPEEIVPAQGWRQNPDGTVTLVAQANTVAPHSPTSKSPCQQVSSASRE